MAPKAEIAVSVIIPNYNGGEILARCLRALRSGWPAGNGAMEIIVVDNDSTDESLKIAQRIFSAISLSSTKKSSLPLFRLIRNPLNRGFAVAANQGIRAAKGNFLFLINNDIICRENTINTMLKSFASRPDIGVVGPAILRADGRPEPSRPKTFPLFCFLERRKKYDRLHEVDFIPGCAMMIKCSVIDSIGFFDEKYFFYFEDDDFCRRVKKAGFKIVREPKAKVTHLGGISSRRIKKADLDFWWYSGKFRFLFKHSCWLQIVLALIIQFLAFPYKVLLRRDGTGRAQIKGFFTAIKEL